ncbi:MAG TPA: SDR family oxidoreductase [Burkholderiales bacterium]|nr:SDR family oxidoreductase [Burkholderiales bacterium]
MKTLLITGANRGIGLEFSKQYAAEGWRVLACSRKNSEAIEALSASHPSLVRQHLLDVSDHGQIEKLGRLLSGESIDLLINNAGIYPDSGSKGFGHTDYGKWMEAFNVNTMATLKMAETFFEQISRSTLKTIATVTSKMGSISENSGGSDYLYRSSKAAVNMVAKSLSIDLKPAGITAVLLHPGWVKTDMGGPGALISVEESVSGMRRVISGLSISDSGKFFSFDGRTVPW